MANITEKDLNALRQGARHSDGVINPHKVSNFDNVPLRMARLVQAGFAAPNPHGDWYITEAGRQRLAQQ